MKQKAVLISGIIGLAFGFLFAGTLGVSFFGSDEVEVNDEDRTALHKDEEGFKDAYNLTESIYIPIYGDDVATKLSNGDTFIIYIGRDTCPYCQQFVPNLMEAAESQGFTEIYHIDTIDPSNSSFVSIEGISSTPTTYLVKDGLVVKTFIGYQTTETTEQLIIDFLS